MTYLLWSIDGMEAVLREMAALLPIARLGVLRRLRALRALREAGLVEVC